MILSAFDDSNWRPACKFRFSWFSFSFPSKSYNVAPIWVNSDDSSRPRCLAFTYSKINYWETIEEKEGFTLTLSSISISAIFRYCFSLASESCDWISCLLIIKLTTFNNSGAAAIELAYNRIGFNLIPALTTRNSTALRTRRTRSISVSVLPSRMVPGSYWSMSHRKISKTNLKFSNDPWFVYNAVSFRGFGYPRIFKYSNKSENSSRN